MDLKLNLFMIFIICEFMKSLFIYINYCIFCLMHLVDNRLTCFNSLLHILLVFLAYFYFLIILHANLNKYVCDYVYRIAFL